MDENIPHRLYYQSVILGILVFSIVILILPRKLNKHIPAETKIYVVDTIHNYVDTLTIVTKKLHFKMRSSEYAREELTGMK